MVVAETRDLRIAFGGVHAVDGVGLQVLAGERRAIIGPNGAGKTTLFNALSGAVSASSGQIFLLGNEVTRVPAHARAQLGLARTFQITNVFRGLSVRENILLAVQAGARGRYSLFRPMRKFRQAHAATEELLERWALVEHAETPADQLSYGDQRKLEIVLAVARAPRLLLLDEPAAGLANEETASIVSFIRELPAEVTVIFIEHDLDMAFAVADRITVLHQGRVIAEGTPDEIRRDPKVTEIYLGKT
jgi:branched-chain amino acid transport system ATP-binding protein